MGWQCNPKSRHPGLDPGSTLSFVAKWSASRPCISSQRLHGRLYVGVTSNLVGRIYQHRKAVTKGHSARYGIKRLVWFEVHANMEAAIRREKSIKRWLREWKYSLIEQEIPK